MSVEVRLLGFDRATDRVGAVTVIPPAAVARAKIIAEVPVTDPEILGSYPLDTAQVIEIAKAAHVAVDPAQYDFF